jgi:hypothetical protein
MISEIRSRGAGGAADEFIELYNPTNAPIVIDSTWTIQGRAHNNAGYTVRFTGPAATATIPSHGHYLIGGTGYTATPTKDASLTASITDAASILLVKSGNLASPIDAVCYYYDATTLAAISAAGFTCEGAPVTNPHNDAAATNTNASLERKPGGTLGNCTDTGISAADFQSITPAKPQNLSSPTTP